MEFTLPLPQQLDKNGVVLKQWATFTHRFQFHLDSNVSTSTNIEATSILLFAAHQQVRNICDSLKAFDSSIDIVKLNKILRVVEQICLPRFILLFERFRYFTLEQDLTETLNDFVHTLRKQVELCEFGDTKDSIMTTSLVNGVNNESFRQSLQNTGKLNFNDAVSMCSSGNLSNQTNNTSRTPPVKKQAQFGRKKAKTPLQANFEDSMYMIPLNDNVNEDVDIDDHIVETVIKKSKPKQKYKKKKMPALSHSGERAKIFRCFQCNNEYATRKSFRRHIAAKHGHMKEFHCKHCKITFATRTECITHCNGHTSSPSVTAAGSSKDNGTTEYQCWYCDEKFPNLADYKKHCQTHTAVRVFYCELCQRKNHTITRMIGHLKGHLSPRYRCEICANCFGKAELLEAHMQTHAAQPVHQCLVCSKNFCSADRLQGHMRTHTGEKRFTCELCGKSFCQKMSLDYHKRVHSGEKPYACDICGKRTASFGYLRKHKQMHSDKRPYVCEVCGKNFRFLSNLNRHRNGHTGRRAFACDVCGRTFIYGEGLRDHIKAGRCPGRKNEEGTPVKRAPRAPRARSHYVPSQLVTSDPSPAHMGTSQSQHPQGASESLLSELPPWPYMNMMRNAEMDSSGSLVVVPPYY